MKYFLLSSLLSIGILNANNQFALITKNAASLHSFSYKENKDETNSLNLSNQPDGPGKMSSVEFKNQKFCRAELKDFEFDAHFSVVSATVYFSGANFKNVERGFITSSSLKPIEIQMSRCIPGTLVVFDDVKVVGPDKQVRTIPGISLLLF